MNLEFAEGRQIRHGSTLFQDSRVRAGMPYSLSWASNKSLVTVTHVGVVTIEEIKRSLAEIAKQSDPGMLPYILVDHRDVTDFPDKAELVLFNEQHYRKPRASRFTAFVVNNVTAGPVNFLLLAGANRGITARAFSDTDEAIGWLLAHDSPES